VTRGVHLTRGELATRADWVRAGLLVAGREAVLSAWDAPSVDQLEGFGAADHGGPGGPVVVGVVVVAEPLGVADVDEGGATYW
jgi:hypothetical protein